ncbi:hypothetical protein UB48_15265 [Pseudomonas sp. 2(2015)]|nr:hypothetical protein UB48_15265 [Pseudomonas sp. 2(2015)]
MNGDSVTRPFPFLLHMGNLLLQVDSIPAQRQALRQAYAAEEHELEERRVDLAWPVRVLVEPGGDLTG